MSIADHTPREITLTQGKVTIICEHDYDWVIEHKWYAVKSTHTYYAAARFGKKIISLHRFINETPDHLVTDHKDGDGLNNICTNLASVRQIDNTHNRAISKNNTLGYPGIRSSGSKWRAIIHVRGKNIDLGTFGTKEQAVVARKRAEHLYGFNTRLAGHSQVHLDSPGTSQGYPGPVR